MQLAIQASIALSVIGAMIIGILLYYHKQTATVWITFTTILFIALGFCLYWQDSIWKNKNTTKITISPSKMEFSGATFVDGEKTMRPAEQYIFSVSNNSQSPIYNVWIEFWSDSINYKDIEIQAKSQEYAERAPGFPIRIDTHGLIMKYPEGKTCMLIAINRLSPKTSYEYSLAVRANSAHSNSRILYASLLKSSNEATPMRTNVSTDASEVIFPTPLPKSGSILGIIKFDYL